MQDGSSHGYSSYSNSAEGFKASGSDGVKLAGKRSYDSVLSVLLLNCSMIGIQFTFAIMSTIMTPYNEFLGLNGTETTVIAVIGPVCGFFIQPIFGNMSDECRSRFGRRRLFILGGVLFIVLSLAFIGYGYANEQHGVAVALSVAGMIVMNISINVMLCPARAIVSDMVSEEAQNKGQIYAAMMMGASFLLCNFIVYGMSFNVANAKYEDYKVCSTRKGFDLMSKAQLAMIVCSIGIAIVIVSQVPTMLYGKETPLSKGAKRAGEQNVFVRMYKQIRYMPKVIVRVCLVFFGSWAGYYPFQMFCSYIYGLQLGSLANAVGSIVTFVVSLFLDKVVRRLGERNTYKISQGVGAVAMIAMVFPFLYMNLWRYSSTKSQGALELAGDACAAVGDGTPAWVIALVCILVGLVGINNAVMNSIPFGIIGKCGGEAKGLYMGILNCCCVLAQALSILIDVIWTAIFPYDGPDDVTNVTPSQRTRAMMNKFGHVVVCAVFSVAAFCLCFLLRNPAEVQASEDPEKKALAQRQSDDYESSDDHGEEEE